METNPIPLIEAKDLSVEFQLGRRRVYAVSGVSLSVQRNRVCALVGESGCGKSTLGRALIRMIEPTAGQVLFEGQPITGISPAAFRPYRRQLQMIFQDPYASLDPRMTIRDIIAEPLDTYRLYPTKGAVTDRVVELLEAVGLKADHLNRYAHQFSGGQRQRVGIARSIALNPAFIVCDEPVSALDVSVQNQILNLLKELQVKFGLTYLFISHDLSVVRFISDQVNVMFLGKLCEGGDTDAVYSNPLHPYTRFLLDAIPRPDPAKRRQRMLLKGELPSPMDPPKGCRFHTRCPYASGRCREEEPHMKQVQGRLVACHLYS